MSKMISPLMRIALVSAMLINCLFSVASADFVAHHRLKDICHPSDGAIPFMKIHNMREAIEQVKSGEQGCEQWVGAISDMEKILDAEHSEDICSESTFRLLRDYHLKWISVYAPEMDKDELREAMKASKSGLKTTPKAIYWFFIDVAYYITIKCTRHAIKEFHIYDLNNLIINENLVEEFYDVRLKARKYLFSDNSKHMLRSHILDITMRVHPQNPDEKPIHLAISKYGQEYSIVSRCRGNFGKIYEELFAPSLRLLSLGYGSALIPEEDNNELSMETYNAWITIIETCEILKEIDFVVDDEFKETREISTEEANRLRATSAPIEPANSSSLPKVEHKPVSLGDDVHVSTSSLHFEDRISRFINKKMSFASTFKSLFKKRNCFRSSD